jgi:hypothetical protein
LPDFHQPYLLGERVTVSDCSVGTHGPLPSTERAARTKATALMLKFLNTYTEKGKSYRSSKRDGGKG